MQSLSFRYARHSDAGALAAFASNVFSETYRGLDDPQEIADYVTQHFNLPAVAALVADSNSTTLLAEAGSVLAGYAVIALACTTGMFERSPSTSVPDSARWGARNSCSAAVYTPTRSTLRRYAMTPDTSDFTGFDKDFQE